jgi:hypothetical protein
VKLVGWQQVVYDALSDIGGAERAVVTRRQLLTWRLISMAEDAHSHTEHAGQAVSLALQRLRDKGLVEFVGIGAYRLTEAKAR